MRYYFLLITFLYSIQINAQEQERFLEFELIFDGQPIKIGEPCYSAAIKDSIEFEALKFYISDLQFFEEEKLVAALEQRHFLIDVENQESLKIDLSLLPQVKFNTLKFNIGIDSLTSVSGAFGGDLDPVNGMYWTWQSGYINFKLEGISNSCPARNHFFQFHIGGYQHPFNSLQEVELKLADRPDIRVKVVIDQLLTKINISETYQIMSPNQQALDFAKNISSIFSISK